MRKIDAGMIHLMKLRGINACACRRNDLKRPAKRRSEFYVEHSRRGIWRDRKRNISQRRSDRRLIGRDIPRKGIDPFGKSHVEYQAPDNALALKSIRDNIESQKCLI